MTVVKAERNHYPESDMEITREFSLEERLSLLSAEERDVLYQDALDRYNDAEEVLHVLNRIKDKEGQDALF